MSSFLVNGGRSLNGKIKVGGSKNAALPIIFSTILLHGTSAIYDVPDISDVRVALELIKNMGAVVKREGRALFIDTSDLRYTTPDVTLTSRIRASSYLLGACLSRFGVSNLCAFGGCNFSSRPTDMHVMAIRTLGGRVDGCEIKGEILHGSDVLFKKVSVGATVNAMLLGVGAIGRTRIFSPAVEPHVYALAAFLRSAGADISFFPGYIEIHGGRMLGGGTATVIPDMIEAGTYLALSLATGSSLEVYGADCRDLTSFITELLDGGASVVTGEGFVRAFGKLDKFVSIVTAPHPAFPTDLQPIIAPLLALSAGGRITEGVWHSRFGYLDELRAFGVKYELEGSSALIKPSHITPAIATSPDLRGGAALLIAALAADGESRIDNAEIIGRGYENIVGKLCSVGAQITEIKN